MSKNCDVSGVYGWIAFAGAFLVYIMLMFTILCCMFKYFAMQDKELPTKKKVTKQDIINSNNIIQKQQNNQNIVVNIDDEKKEIQNESGKLKAPELSEALLETEQNNSDNISCTEQLNQRMIQYCEFLPYLLESFTHYCVIFSVYMIYDNSDVRECYIDSGFGDINIQYLLYILVGIVLLHRIVTCILVVYYTGNICQMISQLFDFEFIHAFSINFRREKVYNKVAIYNTNTPQRWINILKVLFESIPFSIILLVLLFVVEGIQFNVIHVSVGISILYIVFSFTNEDDSSFENIVSTRFKARLKENNINEYEWKTPPNVYTIMFIFRFFDVVSKLFTYALIGMFLYYNSVHI